jgi:hypothetical protein
MKIMLTKSKLVLSLFLCISSSIIFASEKVDQPNIILILMDNFGYGEIGVYGGGALRGAPTPNVDSLATDGFQLTNLNV